MQELTLPLSNTLVVGQRYRVYVVFTAQHFPLWTPLLRLCLRLRQGRYVEWTHSLIVVQDMVSQVLTFYEMAIWDGMGVYEQDYEAVNYSSETNKLTVASATFYGALMQEQYHAIDVTSRLEYDVDYLWSLYYTDTRLTPLTLMTHLFRSCKDKVTWTCSGLVQALLGMDSYVAYMNPLTPDELHVMLLEE